MLGAASSDIEDKFKALEGSSVDDELAKMKSGMLGSGSSSSSSKAGSTVQVEPRVDPAWFQLLKPKCDETPSNVAINGFNLRGPCFKAALPEGRVVSDAIESELEALRKKSKEM